MSYCDEQEYYEKWESDNEEVCEECGSKLEVGKEKIEAWGKVETHTYKYCPNCN